MFTNQIHEEAHLSLKAGNIEKAIVLYTKALELHPEDLNILSDRGVAYLHAKNKELCFKDLNLAIKLQPDYAFRYACRAYAKNHFGDIDGALEDYAIAVKLDPDDAVAQNNYGMLLEEKGYHKEAKERYERADKLSKMEKGLLAMMEQLENGESGMNVSKTDISENEKPADENINSTHAQEIKKVFTSRKQFKEFIQFVKNGFRIK